MTISEKCIYAHLRFNQPQYVHKGCRRSTQKKKMNNLWV